MYEHASPLLSPLVLTSLCAPTSQAPSSRHGVHLVHRKALGKCFRQAQVCLLSLNGESAAHSLSNVSVIRRTQKIRALTDRLDERPENVSIVPLVKLQLENRSPHIFSNLLVLQLDVTGALVAVLVENQWLFGAWASIIPPSLIRLDLSLVE